MYNSSTIAAERRHRRRHDLADDIDFEIRGADSQFVEIELDPGEMAVAEAGTMVYKSESVQMTTAMNDGSRSSFFGKLSGAGKRLMSGEGLFMTHFKHAGDRGKAKVAFAGPYPGHILGIRLSEAGGRLVC